MNNKQKIRIFTTSHYFLPGYKSGGPVQTIVGMIELLGDQFDFYIFTLDRDWNDSVPYPKVQINNWNNVRKSKVYYAPRDTWTLTHIMHLIKSTLPDVIYLNSFFSILTIKTLLLFRFGFIPSIPIVLAPRGEFSPGAIALKSLKKQVYLALTSRIGLYQPVTLWQASSSYEEQDIQRTIGKSVRIHIAPDVSPIKKVKDKPSEKPSKQPGYIRIAFLARITPMKNLTQAIEMLGNIDGQVVFDIYGIIDDADYWNGCQKSIAKMPTNITITYHGAIPNTDVINKLVGYHFFLLPTLGENFGHAILEALTAGCPVIISDQTPWRNLQEKHIGWDIPLDDTLQWQQVLQQCVDMDNPQYQQISQKAYFYAIDHIQSSETKQQNIEIFEKAVLKKRF
jgi:glycosyltransferase involved in cell wall biosynthesis